jgi:hypothetical protein
VDRAAVLVAAVGAPAAVGRDLSGALARRLTRLRRGAGGDPHSAYLWHNMLSKAQCEQMIQIATPRMAKSKVVDSVNGREADDPIRTSYGAVLSPLDDEVLMNDVDAKSAMFAQLPTENAEQIQVRAHGLGLQAPRASDSVSNERMLL